MNLDPRANKWVDNSSISEWRGILRAQLLRQRGYKSDYSGRSLSGGCHVHEGILPRARLSKAVWWHYMIFHPYNCFLLLPEEHIPNPPSVEWCITKSFGRYGADNVREWFYGLPWKVVPFRI